MALTRITTSSISSNSISADKMQNAAIQARHFQTGTITLDLIEANANVAAAEIRLNANINVVSSNVDGITTGIDTVHANVVAAEANVVLVRSNVDSLGTFANTNLDTKANVSATLFLARANDFATFTHITANLDIVQDNVANIIDGTTPFTGAITMNDDLTIQGNLTVAGTFANLAVTDSYTDDRMIMLANAFTGSPSLDVGLLFNRGNQGNAAFFYDESVNSFKLADTKDPNSNTSLSPVSLSNLALGKLSYDGADLSTAIVDNRSGAISSVFATNLTASRALSSDGSGKIAAATTTLVELNHLSGVGSAIQTQLNTKDSIANVSSANLALHANDFVTFTRLNANLNVVSSNVVATETRVNANLDVVQDNVEARNTQVNANLDIIQDNVAALSGGAILLTPFYNVNTSSGSSNVFFLGKPIGTPDNVLYVAIDGIVQTKDVPGTSNNDFVVTVANNTIAFTDTSIPSGLTITTQIVF